MEPKKILIVDDDKFLLDMYSIKFKERGFDPETAFSGPEALEKIDEQGLVPEICLLDVVMPLMDGFKLLEELKKRPALAGTAMIVLSNLGQKEDIDRGLSLGADGYIVKASATPGEVVDKAADIVKHKQLVTK